MMVCSARPGGSKQRKSKMEDETKKATAVWQMSEIYSRPIKPYSQSLQNIIHTCYVKIIHQPPLSLTNYIEVGYRPNA